MRSNGLAILALTALGACSDPSCKDGVKNNNETDMDCGGICGPCELGKACLSDFDCVAWSCVEAKCAPPSCGDGVKNGDETDKDCGGACGKCGPGQACTADEQCRSLRCSEGQCAGSRCDDKVTNGAETDVDCGGTCKPCATGKHCTVAGDCADGVCRTTCAAPSCTDGVRNGTEPDIDCGTSCTAKCAEGQGCTALADCAAGLVCAGQYCAVPSCTDRLKDGSETDVDCGGSCPPCGTGRVCALAADCRSGVCDTQRCAAPACDDLVKNGDESDKDCGGSCDPCIPGKICRDPGDCSSGVCSSGLCAVPTCTDQVMNGNETDVDCGGTGTCSRCPEGKACLVATDCLTANCDMSLGSGVCGPVVPGCDDGSKNGTETDVDCGGTCNGCGPGRGCLANSDCLGFSCNPTGHTCDPACTDAVKNLDETDVDCGGSACAARCTLGKACLAGGDCQSGNCAGLRCAAAPSCTDTLKNQDETDVDCGGATCATRCANGLVCLVPGDCLSGNCSGGRCAGAPSCTDTLKNQDETDVDCGGATCSARCADGLVCLVPGDCQSSVCTAGRCAAAPSCTDTLKNQDETDVDCGGTTCSARCADGLVCLVPGDCQSGNCATGRCAAAPSCTDTLKNQDESDVDCGGATCTTRCLAGRACLVPGDCASGRCAALVCAWGHTLANDSSNDFTAASETFSTTAAGFTAHVTWDSTWLYLAYEGPDLATPNAAKAVVLYVDVDPQATPTGATQSVAWGSQQSALPSTFGAEYLLRWVTDGTLAVEQYSGAAWGAVATPGVTASQSASFVKWRIPLATLGSPSAFGLTAFLVDDTASAEKTYAGLWTGSFTDSSSSPAIGYFLSVDLASAAAPNTAANRKP